MTPTQIRLECLRLALQYGLAKMPDFTLDVAKQFEAYVAGQPAATPEPVEPGSMAEAIDALRREVPPLVRKTMAENYEP